MHRLWFLGLFVFTDGVNAIECGGIEYASPAKLCGAASVKRGRTMLEGMRLCAL